MSLEKGMVEMSRDLLLCGVEFAPTSVVSPNLSGLNRAIEALPPEARGEYFAGFLGGPLWVRPEQSYHGDSNMGGGGNEQ